MQGRQSITVIALVVALAACGGRETTSPVEQQVRSTRITTYGAQEEPIELSDTTIGWVESKATPMVPAEVSGRITRIRVDAGSRIEKGMVLAEIDPAAYRSARNSAAADVERLQGLAENQQRQVQRNRRMLEENFVPASMVEESEAQLHSLQEQLRAARARLEQAERDLANTQIKAPLSGEVDQRLVTAGDFVQAGQPLVRLISGDLLRIHLPFPETVAPRLRAGLPVRLSTPLAPEQNITGEIRELRPSLSRGRAVEAIVEVENPGNWRAGGSVRGTVVLDNRVSVVLPETAVVMRPAGRTVYIVEKDRVRAQVVETGVLRDGKVEILSGLEPDLKVALDGAGFLTDGAIVSIRETMQ